VQGDNLVIQIFKDVLPGSFLIFVLHCQVILGSVAKVAMIYTMLTHVNITQRQYLSRS